MPVSFNDRITAHSAFLSDHRRLRLALFQMGKGEGTRLWDALHLVLKDRLEGLAAGTRGAVVLFTDGVDTRSRLRDAAPVMRELAESNIPVYVVEYDTRGQNRPPRLPPIGGKDLRLEAAPPGAFDSTPYIAAETNLQALADATGGRVFRADTLTAAAGAFDEVARELKSQYTIAYYPTNQSRDGSLRSIVVTARRSGLNLRYRHSYRAPSGRR
jgi:VWFA-related protein